MSKEAMKLALKALEGIHPGNMTPMAEEYWNKAITALREALNASLAEQPAPPPECQTEAEKTAFAFGWFKALESVRQKPAQRTWIGLSDLDIDELENEYMKSAQTAHQFLRAIEAKLRSKNT